MFPRSLEMSMNHPETSASKGNCPSHRVYTCFHVRKCMGMEAFVEVGCLPQSFSFKTGSLTGMH